MGADLCIVMAKLDDLPASNEERMTVLLERAKYPSPHVVAHFIEEYGYEGPEQVVARSEECIRNLFGYDYLRDVDEWNIEGHCILITGGMSWGDPPTESYEEIMFLLDAGLLEAPAWREPVRTQ